MVCSKILIYIFLSLLQRTVQCKFNFTHYFFAGDLIHCHIDLITKKLTATGVEMFGLQYQALSRKFNNKSKTRLKSLQFISHKNPECHVSYKTCVVIFSSVLLIINALHIHNWIY